MDARLPRSTKRSTKFQPLLKVLQNWLGSHNTAFVDKYCPVRHNQPVQSLQVKLNLSIQRKLLRFKDQNRTALQAFSIERLSKNLKKSNFT
ncbi:hypothetical protein L596_006008 [Steinernema carpocapsae]|uniref:Uncharacterized protein n=1 Tax=Steinernema carpocapsae TaxID=34508 RepID=A0A4U8V295_STECR|nr:hypothetical protein L596_006008 [Steinernema carpocapsae]